MLTHVNVSRIIAAVAAAESWLATTKLMGALTKAPSLDETWSEANAAKAMADHRDKFATPLRLLLKVAKGLGLSEIVTGQLKDALRGIRQPSAGRLDPLTAERRIQHDVETALRAFRRELKQYQFVFVPPRYSHLLLGPSDFFGNEVARLFTDAKRDIENSGRCLALGEWTASVFHSMRVLEIALRKLAEHLSVENIQANWQNIIEQIDKRILALSKMPAGPPKPLDLQPYVEAASEFRHFKDAWRNHVAHSLHHYDEEHAMRVYEHTKSFMQVLAARVLV